MPSPVARPLSGPRDRGERDVQLASLTAAVLALLALVVLVRERRAGASSLAVVLAAVAADELLDRLALQSGPAAPQLRRAALLATSLLPVLFIVYGQSLKRPVRERAERLSRFYLVAIALVFVAGTLALPLGDFYGPGGVSPGARLPLAGVGYWHHLGLVIFGIVALVNVEGVFLGTRGADRWAMKFEFVGIFTILAAHIFYLSQGLLYRGLDTRLLPLRSAVVLVAAALIGYSRLRRGGGARVHVSRQVFQRSLALLAVALYLLFLALLGEGVRLLRLWDSQYVTLFIAVVSGLFFVLVLLSEELRRRFRVFVSKHFFAHKHDYREEWLRFTGALAACRTEEDARSAILEHYQQAFGVQSAALYLPARDGRLELVAVRGMGGQPRDFAPSAGLRAYLVEQERVWMPGDEEYTATEEESAFTASPAVWVVVPLVTNGALQGAVTLGPQLVRERLTYEDFDLMKTLARQASWTLVNHRLAGELAEAREMSAIGKVSSFIVHDLKNLAYSVTLVLDNAEQYLGEPEFQRDMVRSLRATVAKMNALIVKLRTFPRKQALATGPVDLGALAAETVEEVRRLRPGVRVECDLGEVRLAADAAELRKVVLNLLLNACDAQFNRGVVRVSGAADQGEAVLRVADEGTGMTEEFMRTGLFQPFRTTKDGGLGIGLYQSRQIVEAHGGRIAVASEPGKGTTFTVSLPFDGGGENPQVAG